MKLCGMYILFMVGGLLTTVCPTHVAYASKISQNQIKSLEQQAQDKNIEYKKLQAQAMQINLDLNKLNTQMITAAQKLQKQEAETTRSESELKILQDKLKISEQEFNIEYQKLAEILSALQNLATHPTQSILVMPLTPIEVVRSAILMRESVPYLNQNAEKIKNDLNNLEKQKNDVENKLKKLEKQKSSLLKQQQNLKKMSEQKMALRKKIEGESKKNKQEALKLAAEASDLRDLLEKAEKEQQLRQRKQEEIKRAAKEREQAAQRRLEEEQKRRIASGKSRGLSTADGQPYQHDEKEIAMVRLTPDKSENNAINFLSARGKLIRPASGNIITSYGEELSKGVNSKGLIIKTRSGAQVVAPYDGTVIFSGPFKGYGNLIIVEHGQGYVSLLAGMNTVDTENGQMVLAGEPVGTMPDTPSAKLYVEIRKNQKPVNPAPWFGNLS